MSSETSKSSILLFGLLAKYDSSWEALIKTAIGIFAKLLPWGEISKVSKINLIISFWFSKPSHLRKTRPLSMLSNEQVSLDFIYLLRYSIKSCNIFIESITAFLFSSL